MYGWQSIEVNVMIWYIFLPVRVRCWRTNVNCMLLNIQNKRYYVLLYQFSWKNNLLLCYLLSFSTGLTALRYNKCCFMMKKIDEIQRYQCVVSRSCLRYTTLFTHCFYWTQLSIVCKIIASGSGCTTFLQHNSCSNFIKLRVILLLAVVVPLTDLLSFCTSTYIFFLII